MLTSKINNNVYTINCVCMLLVLYAKSLNLEQSFCTKRNFLVFSLETETVISLVYKFKNVVTYNCTCIQIQLTGGRIGDTLLVYIML